MGMDWAGHIHQVGSALPYSFTTKDYNIQFGITYRVRGPVPHVRKPGPPQPTSPNPTYPALALARPTTSTGVGRP